MNIKELIAELRKYDPETEVGGIGHYGELLDIQNVSLHESSGTNMKGERQIVLNIEIEDPGQEPY